MVRRFHIDDLDEINRWHVARGVPTVTARELPEFGLIAPGVGAVFIQLLHPTDAQLTGWITNPEASSEVRRDAIAEGYPLLIAEAKARGKERVGLFATAEASIRRALEDGFRVVATGTIMVKEI